jgi:hypothetical protein
MNPTLAILIGSGLATLWFYDLNMPYLIKRYVIRPAAIWKPIKPLDCYRCTVFWFQLASAYIALFMAELHYSYFFITFPVVIATSYLYSKWTTN